MKKFSVTVLGSSAALPTSKRNLSTQLLSYGEQLFLLDCAEGTQMILRKLKVKAGKINHIFISHLHGDHFFGLIGLISTWHLLGRKSPLNIYGPPLLKDIIEMQLRASMTELSYDLNFRFTRDERPEVIADTGNLVVTTIPLKHRIQTTGFLFTEKQWPRKIRKSETERFGIPFGFMEKLRNGEDYIDEDGSRIPNEILTLPPPAVRSFAYCTDTVYDEQLPALIKGCTLLYHEATFLNDKSEQAFQKLHSTAAQAAKIASLAEAGGLLIGHFSARYDDATLFKEEAEKFFSPVFIAEDGETYEIKKQTGENTD